MAKAVRVEQVIGGTGGTGGIGGVSILSLIPNESSMEWMSLFFSFFDILVISYVLSKSIFFPFIVPLIWIDNSLSSSEIDVDKLDVVLLDF